MSIFGARFGGFGLLIRGIRRAPHQRRNSLGRWAAAGRSLDWKLLPSARGVRVTTAVAHFRLGPISSALISTIDRLSPFSVSQLRCSRRPLTMTREPFCNELAAFSAME